MHLEPPRRHHLRVSADEDRHGRRNDVRLPRTWTKRGHPRRLPRSPRRQPRQLGPRIIDAIARNRHVITFDNVGVGASSGKVPDTIEAMAADAYTFISAFDFDTVDLFTFSMGGASSPRI